MGRSLNRVELIGYLGADPETRYAENGTGMATFRVATDRAWRGVDGQARDETQWTPVVVWGALADICAAYLRKGSRVFLEGRLNTRTWQDTASGERRSGLEVIADELILLDPSRRRADDDRLAIIVAAEADNAIR